MNKTDLSTLPVSFEDIENAARTIDGAALRTPVFTSRLVDEHCGCSVFFKCENLQNTGSFKFRGAFNALSKLSDEDKQQGVLTFSSGNHAQALARAGQLLNIAVTIIMPADAPAVKKAATRSYGAEIIEYDKTKISREELAEQVAKERGLPIIPPYNHPHVIAGQGTAARELLQDQPDLDAVLVCCGGGGLLSGSSLSIKSLNPDCRVIGVEPKAADDAARSFLTGSIQSVVNPATIADGARTPSLGTLTFPIVRMLVDEFATVSEEAIYRSMIFLSERLKLVIEPTGALAFAALFGGEVNLPGQRVGVIISGGNLDLEGLDAIRSAATK